MSLQTRPFGEESDEEFDMGSLFTVDEDKLQEAFGFDESALSGLSGSIDLSSLFTDMGSSADLSGMIDLSGISVDLPDMPSMDLGDLLGSLEISVSEKEFAETTERLINGYNNYVKEHPEGDASGLMQSFGNIS